MINKQQIKALKAFAQSALDKADTGTEDCRHYNNGFMDGINFTIKQLNMDTKTIQKHYDNGKLKVRYTLNDKGVFEGLYEEWHENGQLYEKSNWKDGDREGLYEEWYSNGRLCTRAYFKDGKINGLHQDWYEDGQLYMKANYKDGLKYGLHKIWSRDGYMTEETTYKNGKKNGESILWDEYGETYESHYYIDGKEVSQEEYELKMKNDK